MTPITTTLDSSQNLFARPTESPIQHRRRGPPHGRCFAADDLTAGRLAADIRCDIKRVDDHAARGDRVADHDENDDTDKRRHEGHEELKRDPDPYSGTAQLAFVFLALQVREA
jgi:hypothetical protein